MESPHLYDSADYGKKQSQSAVLKVKGTNVLYPNEEYSGDLAELSGPEISLDLHNLISDSEFNEGLIQDIQGLSVDKGSNHTGRGVGVNNGMYNPLPYLPQPVHGAAQFDRHQYHQDRSGGQLQDHPGIKEEPLESHHGEGAPHHEYSSCARIGGSSGYGVGAAAYPVSPYQSMTPTTVPGSDPLALCRSPLKSPMSTSSLIGSCKKNLDKGSDEYKRRRERNNIAVRKSREKAKARTRETEERVKKLIVDNDRLAKKCELLSKEVALFHNMFANVHYLPENVQRELRKQMDAFNQQHQHLVNM